jgi:hypothetical protein
MSSFELVKEGFMPDGKMPDWMTEEEGGEHCDVDFPPGDYVHNKDIDDTVLTASAVTEKDKEKLRNQYAQLFPSEALSPSKEVT